MKKVFFVFILILLFLLTSCGSPFAPIITAPESTSVISSPFDLPESLKQSLVLWHGIVKLDTGTTEQGQSDSSSFLKLSIDQQYIAYVFNPLIVESGLPKNGDYTIKTFDIQTGKQQEIVAKKNTFPDAVLFAAPTFTSDGENIVFVVAWQNSVDLAKANIRNGQTQQMNVDILLTNFSFPDVSSQGQIVVICKGADSNNASELCLLDGNGKFIRYLTSEGHPWPGYGLFTPDGRNVVYESRNRLYEVGIDDNDHQQIAPCGTPLLVTEDYVVASCYVSIKPVCSALFVASLNGQDFRRIGYIDAECNDE